MGERSSAPGGVTAPRSGFGLSAVCRRRAWFNERPAQIRSKFDSKLDDRSNYVRVLRPRAVISILACLEITGRGRITGDLHPKGGC